MKRSIKSTSDTITTENVTHVTMYLRPLIYSDVLVYASGTIDEHGGRVHTDINPSRIINGPLSGPGEELEPPLRKEWEGFLEDCTWLITNLGFKIISVSMSTESKKSEYVVLYGMSDSPCGTLVFDLRLSDHPFDATFPEKMKTQVLQYLKMNKILDGSATEVGIDFQVEKVTVGSVKNDSWDRAYNRLYNVLKGIRRKVRVRLNERK